jgi:hypothetical protein
MEKIPAEFNINEWTVILQCLGHGRFIDVADIITSLKSQVESAVKVDETDEKQ